jgi:HD-GYP domain-containing protein (c-di-GMP phosphodiesterase class II)
LIVRVLTAADVFDALGSERPYRAAWPVDKAINYLRENVGIKFDGAAVDALNAAPDSSATRGPR